MPLMSVSKNPVRESDGDLVEGTRDSAGATRHSTSPVPASATAIPSSPFKIGTQFMQKYYQVLTTSPGEILKFYKQDTSTLSHSLEASTRADPVTLDAEKSPLSIFGWTMSSKLSDADKQTPVPGIRFDFERGAIDAQETVNGGILLVVTGFMYLPSAPDIAKPFVHTFVLLNVSLPGQKKKFYVHNDVLRVMSEPRVSIPEDTEETEKTVVDTSSTPDVLLVTSVDSLDNEKPRLIQEEAPLSQDPISIVKETLETSLDVLHSSSTLDSQLEKSMDMMDNAKGDDKRKRGKKNSRSRKSDASSPVDKTDDVEGAVPSSSSAHVHAPSAPTASVIPKNGSSKGHSSKSNVSSTNASAGNKPKSVSSWAGVVASTPSVPTKASQPGGSGGKGHKSSPEGAMEETKDGEVLEDLDQHDTPTDAMADKNPPPLHGESTATGTNNQANDTKTVGFSNMRNPDATLYIKHIPEKTKESEILSMFEPYAIQMKKKILGITLQPVKGFCFVDFDSREVVDAIMVEVQQLTDEGKTKDASTYKFAIHGQALVVNRKVNENTNKGRGHGGGARVASHTAPPTGTIHKQNTGDGTAATGVGGGKRRNSPRGGRSGGQRPIVTAGSN